jgi:hypothetical protein
MQEAIIGWITWQKARLPRPDPPSATVPPKLEIINTENPKNKTIEV